MIKESRALPELAIKNKKRKKSTPLFFMYHSNIIPLFQNEIILLCLYHTYIVVHRTTPKLGS